MDFKEVNSKSGKKIVFCDLEQLVIDNFGVKTITEADQYLHNDKEYICHCPFCKKEGHTKHKLYVKSDLTTGHCFVCTRAFVNISKDLDLAYRVPEYSFFKGTRKFEITPLSDKTWTLDKFETEFTDFDKTGIDYLNTRHPFMKELYKILGFKFWDGNVVMPFMYKDKLIYYQIRFSGKSKIRYFFPPISAKPPYIIEYGNPEPGKTKIIIVEGVFDAIACLIQAPGYIPFAVLGSSISDYQLGFLKEYVPSEIVIYMDDTEKSIGLANRVKANVGYSKVRVIKSDGTDPEENMVKRLRYGKDLQWIK